MENEIVKRKCFGWRNCHMNLIRKPENRHDEQFCETRHEPNKTDNEIVLKIGLELLELQVGVGQTEFLADLKL